MRLNFKRLGLLGAHIARAFAREVDLTSARFDLMSTLLTKVRRQREIAAILCVSEPVVSRMVSALERDGLVRRETPAHDRRVRNVSLTPEGRKRVETIANDGELWMQSDGRESAQCTGEGCWMMYWEAVLERLGLAQLECIFTQPFHVSEPVTQEPPFWAMQLHARLGAYRTLERFWDVEPIDADQPGKLRPYEYGLPRVVAAPKWA